MRRVIRWQEPGAKMGNVPAAARHDIDAYDDGLSMMDYE
jgi:hypothetical protein